MTEILDPYVYPGTDLLRNLRDIRDPKLLQRFEVRSTTRRLRELESNPIGGSFDAKHLRAIHACVFQDIYSWAGKFRTIDMRMDVPGQFFFARPNRIDSSVAELLGQLRPAKNLRGLPAEAFSERAGNYLGELNAIHPFRDGNGRTQREFIRELAAQNGYALNWSRVSIEQMRAASRLSFQRGNDEGMIEVVRTALEERGRTKA